MKTFIFYIQSSVNLVNLMINFLITTNLVINLIISLIHLYILYTTQYYLIHGITTSFNNHSTCFPTELDNRVS